MIASYPVRPSPPNERPPRVTTLLYHGVPRVAERPNALDGKSFERQLVFLKRHFDLIGPDDLRDGPHKTARRRLLLTFDDGMRNQGDVVVPLLRRYRAPALFFVATRHTEPGRYLWFVYFRLLVAHYPQETLRFRGDTLEMSARMRAATGQRLMNELLSMRPHPGALYDAIDNDLPPLEEFVAPDVLRDHAEGLRPDELADIASDPLFVVGAHTHDHALLTRCTDEETMHQLARNRSILGSAGAGRCDRIAYPCDDRNARVEAICRAQGFTQGFSADGLASDLSPMHVPRVGIHSRSIPKLALKAAVADWLGVRWVWDARRRVACFRNRYCCAAPPIEFRQ